MLGYVGAASTWQQYQTDTVDEAIRSGLRQFYYPLTAEGVHSWNFLCPVFYLSTVNGQREYPLPDNFSSLMDGFAFAAGNGNSRVRIVGEPGIRAKYGTGDASGAPEYCAIRPKQHAAGIETEWEVIFFPVPDAVYDLSYRYRIEPPMLSNSETVALGGAAHSETVRAACLAAASRVADDGPGHYEELFQRRLAASIEFDRRVDGTMSV